MKFSKKLTIFVAIVGIVPCVFFALLILLMTYGSCEKVKRPVYSGKLKVHGCSFHVSACQDIELNDGFRFTIDWNEPGEKLVLGVLEKYIPVGVNQITVKNISITNLKNRIQQHQAAFDIYNHNALKPTGYHIKHTKISLPESITEKSEYQVQILFEIITTEGTKIRKFIGIFRQGNLRLCFPVV